MWASGRWEGPQGRWAEGDESPPWLLQEATWWLGPGCQQEVVRRGQVRMYFKSHVMFACGPRNKETEGVSHVQVGEAVGGAGLGPRECGLYVRC